MKCENKKKTQRDKKRRRGRTRNLVGNWELRSCWNDDQTKVPPSPTLPRSPSPPLGTPRPPAVATTSFGVVVEIACSSGHKQALELDRGRRGEEKRHTHTHTEGDRKQSLHNINDNNKHSRDEKRKNKNKLLPKGDDEGRRGRGRRRRSRGRGRGRSREDATMPRPALDSALSLGPIQQATD